MARFKPIPYSQQELKELLDYNAETGILSWRKRCISVCKQ